ncbi:MAG: outer membrane protein assembly factor BamB family protein [Planctomycetota bacterium]|jgi:outer membrane protein assembly factor BamB
MEILRFPAKLTFSLLILGAVSVALAQPGDYKQKAEQILKAADIKGGLIVHVGCGDGKLTAELYAGDNYLVHGLETDMDKLQQAREYVRSSGNYGNVSFSRFDGKRLPCVDNLVNLAVVEELGDVPMVEVMRVLVPNGVAYVKDNDEWKKTIKPRPKEIDEWTHFLHDPSGNAVAHDQLVGPPRHIQWVAGPPHTRSHEHIPGIYALVSTGGRIFYIADEAPVGSVRQIPKWNLIARDAFNGILLWKKPVDTWFPHIVNWGQTPRQLQRKLVAVGDRVYVTLGLHAPVSAVDAATGALLKVYDNTEGTEEIILHKGTLLLVIRKVTDVRTAEQAKWAELLRRRSSPLDKRETAEPLVKRLRATESKGDKSIVALNADTGRLLWKKEKTDVSGLRTYSLCANGDRVFYQNGRDVVCLNLGTGQQQWSEASATLRFVYDQSIFCSDRKTVKALSAEDGRTLWEKPTMLTQIRDLFAAGGSIWAGGFKPFPTKRGPSWGPYFATQLDLNTGKMLMHIEPDNPSHHHRCYQNKATDRYILGGRRGTEFIDLASGEVLWNSWARGVCKYGVMPCNGLLYTPPHACGCYMGAKLTGFHALAAERRTSEAASPKSARLDKGPAYTQVAYSSSKNGSQWPTYRQNALRSGCTPDKVPAVLQKKWRLRVGGEISAPVIAEGKVFVASVDEHSICAIDADSGRLAWRFTAGARVDSPPSVNKGRVIFGCRDGHVYSLRASDGELAWRMRAARSEQLISAYGRLESASPVIGSVLVKDGIVCCTAGRSSYMDGGIDLYRLDAETGRTLSKTPIYSPDPETGRQPEQFAPSAMPGARADILTSDGSNIYLRDMAFDKHGAKITQANPHLFTLTDFLDDSWPHRSYWIFGTRCSIATGCSGRDRKLIYGRLLVFDESKIYGYGRRQVHWSNQLQDGGYRLFAVDRGDGTGQWEKSVDIQVRAMVMADNVLFVAGPSADAMTGPQAPDEKQGNLLIVISASDGGELAQYQLDSFPVFDGIAAAYGQLFISMKDGSLLCLAEKQVRYHTRGEPY